MKKKLVFFIGGLNFGGMERVVFIAKNLLENDFDIKIVTLYQDAADYEKKDDYYNLNVPPSKKKISTFLKRLLKTIKMKKELKPDIVFSFGMYLNYLNVLSNFAIKNKSTTIAGIRSYDWLTSPFFSATTDKWIMKHLDKINSVSKLIAKDAEKIWGIPEEKNDVIYNPYDVDYIKEKSNEEIDDFEFDKDKYYIVTMGRLADQKGYNNLIRAIFNVVKKHSDIELLILGNGDKKTEIEQMILDYNLQDHVKLLGGKKNPYKYVKKANLYVLSSLSEGFPNALSEAMCIGTPVVSVNCKSGPSEILIKKDDFSFENKKYYVGDFGILTYEMIPDKVYAKRELSESEKSLAEGICYAYENKNKMKEIAGKAQKHMREYSYSKFYETIKKVLNK